MKRRVEADVDMGELWREHRREGQERRAERLPARAAEIEALRAGGFIVVQLSDYHYRIDDRLDLFPVHQRYHWLEKDIRGRYSNATGCAMKFLTRRV